MRIETKGVFCFLGFTCNVRNKYALIKLLSADSFQVSCKVIGWGLDAAERKDCFFCGDLLKYW